MLSQTTSEHAGEPSKDGKYKLFSKIKVLKPNEICTFSYITIGKFKSKKEADNLKRYLETKFARFLVLQTISSIHITKDKFCFLPEQDFSRELDDNFLFKKYKLDKDEIKIIENTIKEMSS